MTLDEFLAEWNSADDCVLVHTSGSTGRPKPLRVEKRRMEASARITCQFLGLQTGNIALLCLPLDYIAGKMMVVRALTCGLRLIDVKPSSEPLADVTEPIDLAAMVPLQVRNSLRDPAQCERLRQVRQLIIGGGAVDDDLAEALKDFPHAVWSTYGMTETLSHIALRRLNGPGRSAWYTPFEGVTLSVNGDGCLVIDAPAVHAGVLVTNDIAELRPDGRFRILGRRDNVVCSGGMKIQMEDVERRLQPHVRVPFMITKAPDVQLGEQVVMLVEMPCDVLATRPLWLTTEADLRRICAEHLPKFWRPRRFVAVGRLPLTDTGKPARAEALALVNKGK